MEKKKNSIKGIIKYRLLPIILIGATAVGCYSFTKNNKKLNENGYIVEEDSAFREDGNYSYLLDTRVLKSENIEKRINFARLIDNDSKSTGNLFTEFTSKFYSDNIMVILPNEYACYTSLVFSKDYFKIDYNKSVYQTLQGEIYTVIETEYEAKDYIDIEYRNIYSLKGSGLSEFQKGDILSSIAVYCQGQLVAYNQSGVGSNSENIKNAQFGNPSSLVSNINLDASINLTLGDLDELEYDMNQNNTEKVLKK